MIEIAIHDIANYDMVQFEQALAGEKVVLTHNGKAINMTPNKNDIIDFLQNPFYAKIPQ